MYAYPKGAPGLEFEDSKTESKPHTRPESKEPDHKKTEVVKTRTEAEPKAKPRTRPESRPAARQDSPERPRSGLGQGSTDRLTAGDRVRFLSEKEQVLEGTVVFMEDTNEGTVVHIAGDTGATVPLHSVRKIEPKPNSEDLYMNSNSTVPPVERQEDCNSLGMDSVVEIDLAKGEKGFGTIRWIGFLPGFQHKMAGLELEEQRGVSDGTFKGQRIFICPEKHAMFVKLSSCRPDSRFCRTSANQNSPYTADSANQNIRNGKEHSVPRTGPYHNGFPPHQSIDDTDDLEPMPPIAAENVERLLIGRMKGIQGHHNSCYMDSALFSLFSVSSVLDSLLFKSTSPRDAEVQRILLQNIVNPLRRYGFVEGRHVMNLRKQLQKHGFSQSFTTDEKDPEEFLTVIMQHILNLDPLLKLSSGGKVQDSFCFQIFLDQNQDLVLPSVQQLLEHSFHSNRLKLSEVPSCLILQMPRFGKKFKMFDKILPSLELDVTDLLLQGPKQCILCGEAALWECPQCFLDPVFSSNGLKLFCDQCSRQAHTHSHRQSHRPDRLDTHHLGHSERFHGNRDKLHLLAVLCIETSHYVSFVKYGPEPQHWLFFDSMADREGEADGYNVPQVSLAPEVSQYLNMSLSELANQVPRDMKGVAKRLICDAYLYLYQSPALHLYT